MHEPEKFVYYPMRKPDRIQPDCPVYVHSYGLAVQKGSGAAFVQVRLVNRCDSPVHSVFFHISGKDISGESLYELRFVPLVDCDGQPHHDFGEEQVLFLPEGNVYSLDIEVEDVLFADGMIWRRQSGQAFLTAEEAGWITCSCGMNNPAEAEACAYCRKPMKRADVVTPHDSPTFLFQEMKTLTNGEGTFLPGEQQGMVDAVVTTTEDVSPPSVHNDPDLSRETEPPAMEVPVQELFPFMEWIAQNREATEGPETVDVPEEESFTEPLESSKEATKEEGSAEASGGEEPTEEPPLPLDMMQETGQVLLELQRRIRERETGVSLTAREEQEEAPASSDNDDGKEERSRGIGFWVLMILLMILLALAGFFGILYWKGYFG